MLLWPPLLSLSLSLSGKHEVASTAAEPYPFFSAHFNAVASIVGEKVREMKAGRRRRPCGRGREKNQQ